MKPELAKQYLADFHAEVKAAAIEKTMRHYIGGWRKIADNPAWVAFFCSVPAYRMAIIWGVTSDTAIRRLDSLQEHGVQLPLHRKKNEIYKYQLSEEETLKYVHEAIEHWKSVGYSQTEIRPEIKLTEAA